MSATSSAAIRDLNDAFRRTLTGGRIMITAGIAALPSDVQAMVIRRIATFSDFTPDNDPYGEHDFGSPRHARDAIAAADAMRAAPSTSALPRVWASACSRLSTKVASIRACGLAWDEPAHRILLPREFVQLR